MLVRKINTFTFFKGVEEAEEILKYRTKWRLFIYVEIFLKNIFYFLAGLPKSLKL